MDIIEIQLDSIRAYLAHVPRAAGLTLRAQILRDGRSNEYARRVVSSRIFETPRDTTSLRGEPQAPIPTIALSERPGIAKQRRTRPKRTAAVAYYGQSFGRLQFLDN